MTAIWIIHRDERLRAALARLSGVGDGGRLGAPDDAAWTTAPTPQVVVLGLSGDLDAELEFAHRHASRLPGARWLLVCPREERAEADRLFDSLPAERIDFPPTAAELRAQIRSATARRPVDGLARRQLRDAVANRFARWFSDLELPEVLRALDPRLAGVPLLVRGEPGTGRTLLSRYVHAFGGSAGGTWLELPCARSPRPADLLDWLREAEASAAPDPAQLTICLGDADALSPAAQQTVRAWVELGLPPGIGTFPRVRWIATVADDLTMGVGMARALTPDLTPDLAQALAGLSVRIPPLRERPEAIEALTRDTALAWSTARGTPQRVFAPDALAALGRHPWPGNQRELEAVIARTLAAEGTDPIHADRLRFHAEGPEPAVPDLDEAFATLTPVPESRAAAPAPPISESPPVAPVGATQATQPAGRDSAAPLRGKPEPTAAPAKSPADQSRADDPADEVRRLVRSLAHEVRNPLVAIRTFASLLPERADDPQFREEFSRVVGADVDRLVGVLDRLGSFAELEEGEPERVDVAAVLEGCLEESRGEIEQRRLLVLKELDRTQPHALAHPQAVELALGFLLQRALAWMPDRADLYLASRRQPGGLHGQPSQRIVFRFYRPGGRGAPTDAATAALGDRETDLGLMLSEQLVSSQHGTLTFDDTHADETVILIDLPAAAPTDPASD
ncbi:MAG: histidine kinase dimerization/phospho-acceptor domain-containing protein [Myxococcota bacterium]